MSPPGRATGAGSTSPAMQGAAARDIWRVSADGGTSERLTRGASGPFACESADGKNLLFQPKDADSPLMAMPLAGGGARQLVACVKNSAFGVGPQGVYYVPCDPSPDPPVHVLDLETGRDRRLGTLDGLMSAPAGSGCVARRQDHRVSESKCIRMPT